MVYINLFVSTIIFILLSSCATTKIDHNLQPKRPKSRVTIVEEIKLREATIIVEGYVMDSSGRAMAGANVSLNGTYLFTETNSEGYYYFGDIDPGRYQFKSMFIGCSKGEKEMQLSEGIKYRVDVTMYSDLYAMKPVLYLYPIEQSDINISFDQEEKLIHCYPRYEEGGWDVIALPDGTLYDKRDEKEYYCLFWESKIDRNFDIKSGFVVEGKDTREFLEEKLEILGLNRREANEFIIFWLPLMENNRYNLVHFSTDEYQSISKLNITPKPDTLIRIHMVLQKLDEPVELEEQILSPIKRSGYTAVEWGGTIIK